MKSLKIGRKSFSLFIENTEIQNAVSELARQINEDYKKRSPVFICILKGAVTFFSDLTRKLEIDPKTEFIELSSYRDGEESGKIEVLKDLNKNIKGKDVLIVEDIMDTSRTLNFLVDHLKSKNPKSLRICTLIDKRERRETSLNADYTGFEIAEGFVIGYGMDYNEHGRNLSDIYVLDSKERGETI